MKLMKASMLVLAIGGAFALGVWTGPYLMDSVRTARNETTTPVVQVDQPASATSELRRGRPSASETRVAGAAARPAANPFEPVMAPSAEPVQKIARAALNDGTDVGIAADGFNDATLFVSAAYAAKNTGIPFMVLKHRMVKEGHTLSEAIRMSRPELDAIAEMERARSKARADVGRIAG
jgi:hypothetical protein